MKAITTDAQTPYAGSLAGVPYTGIRELGEIAMSMDGVLRLYFGESNLPTPGFIVEAAVRALNDGYTFSSENAGLPSLRRAIAAQYQRFHSVDLDSEREIVVTASGVQAVVVTSPSNPLGWVAEIDEQRRLLHFCRDRGLWLLADEVYERIYYEGSGLGRPARSILRLCNRDDAVHVVQSFSKSYCMTGWRVGWLVTRADLGQKLAQLNEFFVSHAATFAQVAAQTALAEGEGELHRMLETLKANRDFCVNALRELPGVTVPQPEGAFYVVPRIDGLDDSVAFCRRLLVEQRVGLAPGSAFGAGGEGSVRISYAADRSVLEPALERLERFLRVSS